MRHAAACRRPAVVVYCARTRSDALTIAKRGRGAIRRVPTVNCRGEPQAGEDERVSHRQLLRSADTSRYAPKISSSRHEAARWSRWPDRRSGGALGDRSTVAPYLDARDGIKAQLKNWRSRYATSRTARRVAGRSSSRGSASALERLKRKNGGSWTSLARRDRLRRSPRSPAASRRGESGTTHDAGSRFRTSTTLSAARRDAPTLSR